MVFFGIITTETAYKTNPENVVGKTDTALLGNKVIDKKKVISIIKNRETSMGDIIADSMIWGATKLPKDTIYKDMPMIAMTNGGSSLAVKLVSPKKLYQTLEYSVSELKLNKDFTRIQNLSASYPQIAGMRFGIALIL